MEETQVRRLICVTGFGAGDSRGHGGFLHNAVFHLLLGRVYDDKDVQERIVRDSKEPRKFGSFDEELMLNRCDSIGSFQALMEPLRHNSAHRYGAALFRWRRYFGIIRSSDTALHFLPRDSWFR